MFKWKYNCSGVNTTPFSISICPCREISSTGSNWIPTRFILRLDQLTLANFWWLYALPLTHQIFNFFLHLLISSKSPRAVGLLFNQVIKPRSGSFFGISTAVTAKVMKLFFQVFKCSYSILSTAAAPAQLDIVIFIGWIIVLFAGGDWLDLLLNAEHTLPFFISIYFIKCSAYHSNKLIQHNTTYSGFPFWKMEGKGENGNWIG